MGPRRESVARARDAGARLVRAGNAANSSRVALQRSATWHASGPSAASSRAGAILPGRPVAARDSAAARAVRRHHQRALEPAGSIAAAASAAAAGRRRCNTAVASRRTAWRRLRPRDRARADRPDVAGDRSRHAATGRVQPVHLRSAYFTEPDGSRAAPSQGQAPALQPRRRERRNHRRSAIRASAAARGNSATTSNWPERCSWISTNCAAYVIRISRSSLEQASYD